LKPKQHRQVPWRVGQVDQLCAKTLLTQTPIRLGAATV